LIHRQYQFPPVIEAAGIHRNAEEHRGQKNIFYTVARIPLCAHGIQHASSREQTELISTENHVLIEQHGRTARTLIRAQARERDVH
jgi:microcystin-dependent protein